MFNTTFVPKKFQSRDGDLHFKRFTVLHRRRFEVIAVGGTGITKSESRLDLTTFSYLAGRIIQVGIRVIRSPFHPRFLLLLAARSSLEVVFYYE